MATMLSVASRVAGTAVVETFVSRLGLRNAACLPALDRCPRAAVGVPSLLKLGLLSTAWLAQQRWQACAVACRSHMSIAADEVEGLPGSMVLSDPGKQKARCTLRGAAGLSLRADRPCWVQAAALCVRTGVNRSFSGMLANSATMARNSSPSSVSFSISSSTTRSMQARCSATSLTVCS